MIYDIFIILLINIRIEYILNKNNHVELYRIDSLMNQNLF